MPANSSQPGPDSYQYPSAAGINLPTAETATYPAVEPALEEEPLTLRQEAEVKRYPILNWKRSTIIDRVSSAGPLYVHDKIFPEEFIKTFLKEPKNQQGSLGFAAANGFTEEDGSPAQEVEMRPYQYQNGHWTNRLIRATAQRAMASLLEKEHRQGEVNLIYMDPPYNINFRSNFQTAVDSAETEETLSGIPQDPKSIKAFRDAYRDGVHSYLDGLHEQLTLARELLAEDGSIIMQIGPENLHQVAMLLGEVFGLENHVATIPYITSRMQAKFLGEISNWLIWYTKNKESAKGKYQQLYRKERLDHYLEWSHLGLESPDGKAHRKVTPEEHKDPSLLPKDWRLYRLMGYSSSHTSFTGRSDDYYHHPNGPCPKSGWTEAERRQAKKESKHQGHICNPEDCQTPLPDNWKDHQCNAECHQASGTRHCPLGRKCGSQCHSIAVPCPKERHWSVSLAGLHASAAKNRLLFEGEAFGWKIYADEHPGRTLGPLWDDAGVVPDKQYIVETPPKVLERCILMTTDPGDLVLDLTCGSGAMPVQCETWGRRWLAIDVSAISLAIARERIATTLYPYHLLKDSPEGHKRDHELEQELYPSEKQIPFTTAQKPATAYRHDPAAGFVNERQLRVSAAVIAYGPNMNRDIIRHPDRTKQDSARKRTAAPFLVVSDSPNRAITPEQAQDDQQEPVLNPVEHIQENGFAVHLKKNLQLAGIKQLNSNAETARFQVEDLEPAEQTALSYTGNLINSEQKRHKACFYIGNEEEAITARTTRDAIRAANREPNAEYLVMIGFEIQGDAHAIAKEYKGVTVLQVQANRDLQIPHLKGRDTDNAFTIISEPEVQRCEEPNGQISLKVTGLNAFNPKSMKAEYSGPQAVVGIMVDTEYDGNSFRARLINVKENRRNQRTLKLLKAAFQKNLDPAKWERMTSHQTLPFTPNPEYQIAVKVIDRAGMEHMTILEP